MYRYSLNSKQKFECPACGHSNRFVKYMDNTTGLYISGDYGRCDRQESCGYHKKPANNFVGDIEGIVPTKPKNLFTSDSLNSERYLKYFHNVKPSTYYDRHIRFENLKNNEFLYQLIQLFGENNLENAYNLYRLGVFLDGGIIFPYYFENELKSAKIVFYNSDLHRNKFKNPLWLHSFKTYNYIGFEGYPDIADNPFYDYEYDYYLKHTEEYSDEVEEKPQPFELCLPLFGWDLLGKYPEKTVCLVEAEKTAIICSICFPDFIWLATGGKNNLQQYKFNYYNGRTWLFFPDLSRDNSTSDYWRQLVKKYQRNIRCLIISLTTFHR